MFVGAMQSSPKVPNKEKLSNFILSLSPLLCHNNIRHIGREIVADYEMNF